MKKIIAAFLCAVMLCGIALPVSAKDTKTISLKKDKTAKRVLIVPENWELEIGDS